MIVNGFIRRWSTSSMSWENPRRRIMPVALRHIILTPISNVRREAARKYSCTWRSSSTSCLILDYMTTQLRDAASMPSPDSTHPLRQKPTVDILPTPLAPPQTADVLTLLKSHATSAPASHQRSSDHRPAAGGSSHTFRGSR